MVEEQDVELTFSHKNINHTSTSGPVHTEHLLNAERRPHGRLGNSTVRMSQGVLSLLLEIFSSVSDLQTRQYQ